MKRFPILSNQYLALLFIILLSFKNSYGQKWIEENSTPLLSISPHNEDYHDLLFLKDKIGDSKIVLLGEQTHGDGATFEAKSRLIKFLHKKMDFDIIAFEGEMYGLNKANEAIKEGENPYTAFEQCLYSVWSYAEEFRPFMDYISSTHKTKKPLTVTGFDIQNGSGYMEELFISDLQFFLNTSLQLHYSDDELRPIEVLVNEIIHGDFKNYLESDAETFREILKKIQQDFDKANLKQTSNELAIWHKLLSNLSIDMEIFMEEKKGISDIIQNKRDREMAKNLLFLRRLYPDKKIVCWGASYHFAKSWNTIEPDNKTTSEYLEKIKVDQRSPDYSLSEMSKGISMGEILDDSLGNDLYTIGFTSYTGNYMWDTIRPVYNAPEGSIEFVLKDLDYAYLDLSNAAISDSEKMFYCMPEGYIPIKANWKEMFDGIFFIRDMYPTSALKDNMASKEVVEHDRPNSMPVVFSGVLINTITREPIPFASISTKDGSIATATNEEGRFVLKIPQSLSKETILFSAIGYENHIEKSSKLSLLNSLIIELTPGSYTLNEITIKADKESARQIVKKAIRNIDRNYFKDAYSVDLYYRMRYFGDDTLRNTNEAALLLYNKSALFKVHWKKLIKQKYLQLTEFRSSSPGTQKSFYPQNVWVSFSHDYIATRDNCFSKERMPGFEYIIVDVIQTRDTDVYKIYFNCRKKLNFFTGWGSPDSLSGYLYIDKKDYALIRYEYHLETSWNIKKTLQVRIDDVTHTYRKIDGAYYPALIKEETTIRNDVKESKGYRSEKIILATEINSDSPIVLKENSKSFNTDVPYNKEFWDSFNIIVKE